MSPPLRVLHLQDDLSTAGGAQWHLLAVLGSPSAGVAHRVAAGRVETGPLPIPPDLPVHRVPGLGGRQREEAGVVRRLDGLLAREAPDVVHVHNVLQPGVLGFVADRLPTVHTVQDHRSFCPGRGRWTPTGGVCTGPPAPDRCRTCTGDTPASRLVADLTAARREALARIHRLVVLSRYMADELGTAGLDPGRIRVIPPFPWAFPAPDPDRPPAPPCLLAASRLVEAKGLQDLVVARARSRTTLPLVIAGEGPFRPALEDLVHACGLGSQVHFPGWLSHGALGAVLRAARALVLPSRWPEPFGIAGLEALAVGVPVVATRVGGIPEWLPEDAGWLVPPADPDALARALDAADEPAEARRRGERGRRHVREAFDGPSLMARLQAVYRDAGGCIKDEAGDRVPCSPQPSRSC